MFDVSCVLSANEWTMWEGGTLLPPTPWWVVVLPAVRCCATGICSLSGWCVNTLTGSRIDSTAVFVGFL